MKALIASEDPRSRSWTRMALGPEWEFIEAADGLEAKLLVEREKPDLMVSDETMEHYGGFGLIRDAKLLPTAPAAIVLLERAQDTWLAKWANSDRWFVRPVDPFELLQAARELTKERAGARANKPKRGGAS